MELVLIWIPLLENNWPLKSRPLFEDELGINLNETLKSYTTRGKIDIYNYTTTTTTSATTTVRQEVQEGNFNAYMRSLETTEKDGQ